MFGVPALCEIGGRGLVPRQHSAISTDAPDEVGAFVVADAPLVACFASLLRFCPQATLEDTFADMLEVAPVGATSIIVHGDRLGHVCRHVGGCDGWGGQHFQREFFGHGHIVVFVERPRHALAILALREVLLCKKRAVVTSLLKAMLLEVGAGALGMCTF